MIDFNDVMRNLILTKTAITERIGDRLWMERRTPAPGYKISDGQAIVMYVRGGVEPDYNSIIFRYPYVVKMYGIDPLTCNQLSGIYFDNLNNLAAQYVMRFYIDMPAQTVQEPDTGWFYSLNYYTGIFRNG